jgi:hypothetical protein
MHLFFLHPAAQNWQKQQDDHTIVHPQEPPAYMNEGGEFLDDAIRMEDQPLAYTEEGAAAENAQNSL